MKAGSVDTNDVDTVKRLLDEARLQAKLARMEARDRLVPLAKRVEGLANQVDRRFAEVRKTQEWDELEQALRDALSSLRREVGSADEFRQ